MPAIPDDINALFDAIIDGKCGPRTLLLHSSALQGPGITYGVAYTTSAGGSGTVAIPLRDGDRITAIRVFVKDSATTPTKLQASFCSGDMHGSVPTVVASSNVSAGDGSDQTLTITPASGGAVLAKGTYYCLSLGASSGSDVCRIYAIEIDFDHP